MAKQRLLANVVRIHVLDLLLFEMSDVVFQLIPLWLSLQILMIESRIDTSLTLEDAVI